MESSSFGFLQVRGLVLKGYILDVDAVISWLDVWRQRDMYGLI